MANSAKYIVNEKVSLKFDQKVVLMTLSTTHGKTRLNMQRIYLYLSSIYRHSGIIHLIICLTLNNSGKLETDFQNFGNRSLAPLSNLIHRWRCSLVFIFFFIGGSSIGCARSAGNLPAFHLTYTPFKNNETHLMRYWPKVPKYYIDKDQEPENMQGKKC